MVVKCNQNGKESSVKIKDLFKDYDTPLTRKDLVKGAQLMLNYKEKMYPVTFLRCKGWSLYYFKYSKLYLTLML